MQEEETLEPPEEDEDGDIGGALEADEPKVNGHVEDQDVAAPLSPPKMLSRLTMSPGADYADQADVAAFESPILNSARETPRVRQASNFAPSTPRAGNDGTEIFYSR